MQVVENARLEGNVFNDFNVLGKGLRKACFYWVKCDFCLTGLRHGNGQKLAWRVGKFQANAWPHMPGSDACAGLALLPGLGRWQRRMAVLASLAMELQMNRHAI